MTTTIDGKEKHTKYSYIGNVMLNLHQSRAIELYNYTRDENVFI